jgi:TusA-related sulfurtransferase
MSVTNQRATCPGPLIEQRPGLGECARGDECEVLALADDYLAYRNAHMRVTNEWQARPAKD